jgi:hypothetical protein
LSFYSGSLLLNSIIDNSIEPTFYLYITSTDSNKQKLINLLNSANLNNIPNVINDTNFVTNILNQLETTYLESLTYTQLYDIINDAILEYIFIYFYRSTIFIDPDIPITIDNLITRFKSTIIDYTQIQNIKNSLNALSLTMIKTTTFDSKPIISTYHYYKIIYDLTNGIELVNTSSDSDIYDINNAISYVNGYLLVGLILENFNNNKILITKYSLSSIMNNHMNSNVNYYLDRLFTSNQSTNINLINLTIHNDNYILSRFTNNNIINNISLYDLTTDTDIINKHSLLIILDEFKHILSAFKESYNIQNLFIDKFTTTFSISIKYNDIFKIINDGIKNYFDIYLLRTIKLSNQIVNIFNNHIIDFTNSINIINTLNYLINNNLITIEQSTKIKSKILNISSFGKVVKLEVDPTISDDYFIINALSYYSGNFLLNYIKNNNECIIFDIDNVINIENKKILLELIKSFFLVLDEYYDSTNLLYQIINNNNITNFSDIFLIINIAAEKYFKLIINNNILNYTTIFNYLDYNQSNLNPLNILLY